MDIEQELAALRRMTVSQLREKYGAVFGEPPRSRHKEHLIKRIAWRLQALREGGLPERARRRAAELTQDADLRLTGPRAKCPAAKPTQSVARRRVARHNLPPTGTILVREYKGAVLQVEVLVEGFSYEGHVYKSLTGVARAITGKHWNGYHFFGLSKQESA